MKARKIETVNSFVLQFEEATAWLALIWFVFTFIVAIGIQFFTGDVIYDTYMRPYAPWLIQSTFGLIVGIISISLRCIGDYLRPEVCLPFVCVVVGFIYRYDGIWNVASVMVSM
jgi:hypothetical protein